MLHTPQDTIENQYRIALTLLNGIGPVKARKIISLYENATAFFEELRNGNFKSKKIKQLSFDSAALNNALHQAEREINFLEKSGGRMLNFTDKDYPYRLKNCDDSPAILFTKGTMNFNKQRFVAIVGTRKATSYGLDQTEKIIAQLSENGCSLVSGLAYGIDAAAHQAALKTNIQNIGVVAHGLDMLYPALHKPFAEKMKLNGGIVTDYLSGTLPNRENFPSRNRIIAGLCDAVIIVEAASKGGALITAEIASSYDREVFAIPGRLGDKYSEGCNILIRNNKAAILSKPEDLSWYMRWDQETEQIKNTQLMLFSDLSDDEEILFNLMRESKIAELDSLAFQSGFSINKTVAMLLELEFKGLLKSLPGKRYQLKT